MRYVPSTRALAYNVYSLIAGQTTPCSGTGDHIVGPQAPGGYIASTDAGLGTMFYLYSKTCYKRPHEN